MFITVFPNVENYIAEFSFGLAGGGELLRLYNEFGELVDDVEYNDNEPWPDAPDGNGPTLELIDPLSDNSIPENWAASNGYGTPGRVNSVSQMGDLNEDGIINILDVVILVNVILSGEYNLLADVNEDGNNDVLDIVNLINIVLGLNRIDDATFAEIKKVGGVCKVVSDGYIGAIQMELSHDIDFKFDLISNGIITDYRTSKDKTVLVVVNPSHPDIFSSLDEYRIESILIANSSRLINVNMPNEFSLSHAYPNPFNNSTSIDFNIPIDSKVTIKIYNILGEEVVTLLDSQMEAGYHHLVWDASLFASGIYFINMISSKYSHTEKVILLK
tara:strand:- start:66 stop:1055 length:990 start_codon:yes stop_codon:yes gene_type:complete